MDSELEFRWATPTDQSAVFAVVCRAFHLLRGSSKWKQASELVRRDIHSFRVALRGGEVIGSAHLSRHSIQIGRSHIELGYLGQISILPEHQNRGLGSALVRNLLAMMRDDGYDVARLSGLVRFYSRFGWSPFPRRFVEFPLQKLQAGTAEVSIADMLEPRQPPRGVIRDYRPNTDRRQRDELLRGFNHQRTGAARDGHSGRWAPFSLHVPKQWQIVCEREGRLVAYVDTHLYAEDVSGFEAAVNMRELAYADDEPLAVIDLIRHVLWTAYQRGARRVTGRLPWDTRLFGLLREAGLPFERVELFNSVTGNMLQVVHLKRLFEHIADELTVRWQRWESSPDASLSLRVGEESVGLALSSAGVAVVDAETLAAPYSVTLSPHEFLTLLLGLAPAETVIDVEGRDHRELRIIRALFPMQPTASSVWG